MNDEKVTYGIWLKKKGWLRGGKENKVFATSSLDIVKQLSKRIGSISRVYYIDESLVDLEVFLLEMEKRNNLFVWLQRLTRKAGN